MRLGNRSLGTQSIFIDVSRAEDTVLHNYSYHEVSYARCEQVLHTTVASADGWSHVNGEAPCSNDYCSPSYKVVVYD